jgi:hypothetical protein
MNRSGVFLLAAGLAAVLSPVTPVLAQAPPTVQVAPAPSTARPIDRNELRRHIYVMEGALARAVSFGAARLNREIRSAVPEMMAISGDPQARGVYLDGYGVFFDVGVPILHQSMVWSLRTMLGQDPKALADAFNVLKQVTKDIDGPRRAAAENALMRLELQIGPVSETPADAAASENARATASPAVGAALSADVAPPPTGLRLDKRALQDPNAINRAYTELVQRELVDAMIDYSLPMAIGQDEYLTVAARDNMQRDTLAPPDPHEEIVTILLRIKGSDLASYRAGQIDRDEVRKRVQVKEF